MGSSEGEKKGEEKGGIERERMWGRGEGRRGEG